MSLNDDILDAIRNRRYSLRHIDKPTKIQKSNDGDDTSAAILSRILERRIRMEFSEDSDDNNSCHNFDEKKWKTDKPKFFFYKVESFEFTNSQF